MIDPNEIVTIDELHAAMQFTQGALKAGMPMTAQEKYEFEKLIVEFRMRRAIRDEILRIAEEMADEDDAAQERADAERAERLAAARIANAAYEPTSTYYGAPSVSIKLL